MQSLLRSCFSHLPARLPVLPNQQYCISHTSFTVHVSHWQTRLSASRLTWVPTLLMQRTTGSYNPVNCTRSSAPLRQAGEQAVNR